MPRVPVIRLAGLLALAAPPGILAQEPPDSMESLDRIEIVRGPGAALYGTSAVFAVINLITKS